MMRGWAVLATGLLFLVPSALAAEGTLTGRAALPLEVDGLHTAAGFDARFLLEGDQGTAAFLLQGASGQATRVIHRAWGYVNSQDPQAEVLWDDATETKPLDLAGSLLSLDARRPHSPRPRGLAPGPGPPPPRLPPPRLRRLAPPRVRTRRLASAGRRAGAG